MTREELQKQALETVSAEFYYELADNMDATTDTDLHKIISFGGDYSKELAYQAELEQVK